MSLLRIEVDPGNLAQRVFTDIEKEQIPFATRQATNAVAFQMREEWRKQAMRQFDRPRALTLNAILYRKAVKGQRDYAEVYVRDEAFKGTPPAKYLQAQVNGGERKLKPFERLLRDKGILPAGEFAVPGKGAQLDSHGNIKAAQITQILSQLGAQNDPQQNTTEASTARRRNKRVKSRGGEYFAPRRNDPNRYRHAHLALGVYERVQTGFGGAIRSVLHFVRQANYQPRFKVFEIAQRQWQVLMPFYFNRELAKAVASSRLRGRS